MKQEGILLEMIKALCSVALGICNHMSGFTYSGIMVGVDNSGRGNDQSKAGRGGRCTDGFSSCQTICSKSYLLIRNFSVPQHTEVRNKTCMDN